MPTAIKNVLETTWDIAKSVSNTAYKVGTPIRWLDHQVYIINKAVFSRSLTPIAQRAFRSLPVLLPALYGSTPSSLCFSALLLFLPFNKGGAAWFDGIGASIIAYSTPLLGGGLWLSAIPVGRAYFLHLAVPLCIAAGTAVACFYIATKILSSK
jgi:hypothetical protein